MLFPLHLCVRHATKKLSRSINRFSCDRFLNFIFVHLTICWSFPGLFPSERPINLTPPMWPVANMCDTVSLASSLIFRCAWEIHFISPLFVWDQPRQISCLQDPSSSREVVFVRIDPCRPFSTLSLGWLGRLTFPHTRILALIFVYAVNCPN